MLELSRKLATIDTTLALDVTPEQLTPGAPDVPRLRELYTRMELRALLKSLGAEPEPPAGEGAAEIEVVVAENSSGAGTQIAAAVAVVNTPAPRDYHRVM